MPAAPIALQLYTVRSLTKDDFFGTLRKLAEGGCTAVEFAGLGGHSAAEMKQELDSLGITAAGAHVSYALWHDNLAGAIKELQTLGCEHATIPYLDASLRPETAAEVSALARTFAGWQKACAAEGIRLGYHNHDFEFKLIDGVTIYDRLAEATDLDLQLDVYWAKFVGFDAAPLIEKYAGRMPQLHVKEYAKDGSGADAPFGEGAIDWDRVLPAAHRSGTKWYIAEQDTPTDALADSILSLRNLRAKLKSLGIT